MKLVIDTNVLVSAVLRGGLPERVLKRVIAHDDWQWVVTSDLHAEYERVIRRPHLGIPLDAQEEWLRLTRQHAIQMDIIHILALSAQQGRVLGAHDARADVFVGCRHDSVLGHLPVNFAIPVKNLVLYRSRVFVQLQLRNCTKTRD